jgi:hypothetical protein
MANNTSIDYLNAKKLILQSFYPKQLELGKIMQEAG